MTTTTQRTYQVTSQHFDFHPAIECASFSEAVKAAKARGFEAYIRVNDELVATWSAVYGVHIYNRELAQ